jgi:hypothetical protein
MSLVEKKVPYFKETGAQNTDALLRLVEEYVKKEDIKDIVVTSTTGETGAKASKIFKGCNVIVVTRCFGFREPGESELLEEHKREILANGAKIFTSTHALNSAKRAIRKDFDTIQLFCNLSNMLNAYLYLVITLLHKLYFYFEQKR